MPPAPPAPPPRRSSRRKSRTRNGRVEVPELGIEIQVPSGRDVPRERIEAALHRALELGGPRAEDGARVPSAPGAPSPNPPNPGAAPVELSVTFLEDDPIRALNREWLEHDWVPDVLSFELGEGGILAGDIYVGLDQAARQAEEAGVPLEEELVRLALHGALHVLGFDHPEAAEDRAESPLYRRQEAILREVFP
ncbi:MAG: rRNA maturation RNase YbeY [Gemmatimonadales bacterium]|nr:MAG: rRNA maturation RNase YbeY [Gemmatimonadales bacterium]